MITNKYESTYDAAYELKANIKGLDRVVEFMRAYKDTPMQAKDIGKGIWGDDYCPWGECNSQHLTQLLLHLKYANAVKYFTVDGAPVTIKTSERRIPYDAKGKRMLITFTDDEGNPYEVQRKGTVAVYRWEAIEKTITPKIGMWQWTDD